LTVDGTHPYGDNAEISDDIYSLHIPNHCNIMANPIILELGQVTLPSATFFSLPDDPDTWHPVQPKMLAHSATSADWLGKLVPGTKERCKNLGQDLVKLQEAGIVELWLLKKEEKEITIKVTMLLGEEGLDIGSVYKKALARLFRCLSLGEGDERELLSTASVSSLAWRAKTDV
jgi:hypothetical protein